MLFDFAIAEIGDGTVTFEVTPDESAYNPIGMVHGGLVCTLHDTVTGCAVHTQLPAGTAYAHIDLRSATCARSTATPAGWPRAAGSPSLAVMATT